jgi:hypothetical protein
VAHVQARATVDARLRPVVRCIQTFGGTTDTQRGGLGITIANRTRTLIADDSTVGQDRLRPARGKTRFSSRNPQLQASANRGLFHPVPAEAVPPNRQPFVPISFDFRRLDQTTRLAIRETVVFPSSILQMAQLLLETRTSDPVSPRAARRCGG